MVSLSDTHLMQKALDAAWAYQVLTFPNPAVGAVVSDDSHTILGIGAHQKAGTSHAEVLALKAAYIALSNDHSIENIEDAHAIHTYLSHHHQNLFHQLTLHVTLEPCHHFGKTPPCSQLIKTLGLKRVVIGSYDKSQNAQGGGIFLRNHGIKVEFGCLQEPCDLLLTPFTCKEKKEPFVFYKLALSRNNVATGGIITSEASRKMVHQLRDCCDLLVIGGNTVRIDRPILDARLALGKAPNILIYSHQKEFDTSIALFQIPKRNVEISDSLASLQKHQMVMVEGGSALLKRMISSVRWYLIFRSPHDKEGEEIVLPQGLKLIYSQAIGEDTMSWYYLSGE